jgi:hypothetical protein
MTGNEGMNKWFFEWCWSIYIILQPFERFHWNNSRQFREKRAFHRTTTKRSSSTDSINDTANERNYYSDTTFRGGDLLELFDFGLLRLQMLFESGVSSWSWRQTSICTTCLSFNVIWVNELAHFTQNRFAHSFRIEVIICRSWMVRPERVTEHGIVIPQ